MTDAAPEPRTGTVALMGRPNAGKSTLMNRWLGQKLAIVSDKPQTTRHRLIGLLTEPRGQMVFYDTPGVHRPLHHLNRQMVRHAVEAMNQADIVCLLVDAASSFGRGDAYMLDLVRRAEAPRLLALNKIDRVSKLALLPLMQRYGAADLFEEIVPISARTGDGADDLLDLLWERLPHGLPVHDPEALTTQPERYHVAERIREQILRQTRDEIPFTSTVVIDRWEDDPDGRIVLFASILVETPGQKKIVIGRGGERIREIGTRARLELQEFLGRRMHLELHVRLEPRWRENRQLLARLERELEGDLLGS
ncbi:MAG: GTPase Era [Acidobacteria bacterium]|nr:GTPase Era [Acidobacteriota bacterium]